MSKPTALAQEIRAAQVAIDKNKQASHDVVRVRKELSEALKKKQKRS